MSAHSLYNVHIQRDRRLFSLYDNPMLRVKTMVILNPNLLQNPDLANHPNAQPDPNFIHYPGFGPVPAPKYASWEPIESKSYSAQAFVKNLNDITTAISDWGWNAIEMFRGIKEDNTSTATLLITMYPDQTENIPWVYQSLARYKEILEAELLVKLGPGPKLQRDPVGCGSSLTAFYSHKGVGCLGGFLKFNDIIIGSTCYHTLYGSPDSPGPPPMPASSSSSSSVGDPSGKRARSEVSSRPIRSRLQALDPPREYASTYDPESLQDNTGLLLEQGLSDNLNFGNLNHPDLMEVSDDSRVLAHSPAVSNDAQSVPHNHINASRLVLPDYRISRNSNTLSRLALPNRMALSENRGPSNQNASSGLILPNRVEHLNHQVQNNQNTLVVLPTRPSRPNNQQATPNILRDGEKPVGNFLIMSPACGYYERIALKCLKQARKECEDYRKRCLEKDLMPDELEKHKDEVKRNETVVDRIRIRSLLGRVLHHCGGVHVEEWYGRRTHCDWAVFTIDRRRPITQPINTIKVNDITPFPQNICTVKNFHRFGDLTMVGGLDVWKYGFRLKTATRGKTNGVPSRIYLGPLPGVSGLPSVQKSYTDEVCILSDSGNSKFSICGDSGSWVVGSGSELLGFLFAGIDNEAPYRSYMTDIRFFLKGLHGVSGIVAEIPHPMPQGEMKDYGPLLPPNDPTLAMIDTKTNIINRYGVDRGIEILSRRLLELRAERERLRAERAENQEKSEQSPMEKMQIERAQTDDVYKGQAQAGQAQTGQGRAGQGQGQAQTEQAQIEHVQMEQVRMVVAQRAQEQRTRAQLEQDLARRAIDERASGPSLKRSRE